ncbi:uncharacterized protein Z519_08322 [Cladophialophora bantiana CBS 173.52]|uniref:DUF1783-domain-containing protein n=1 Tax=Cladophialophora bantiana (strain ATCC 10958 / CBS 173.52 / CDC B-1940 / NIH 8579) TaxID=1442370 RepID=A0A0D2EN49_CLAB1|nr:uncharacterized protein Z519_08322 [Cladophialophora bantiana CBS 173.52]KIW91426.1 hypothetical protein Z519_08322 [Cladophialophora bantiana CBS 173.52]
MGARKLLTAPSHYSFSQLHSLPLSLRHSIRHTHQARDSLSSISYAPRLSSGVYRALSYSSSTSASPPSPQRIDADRIVRPLVPPPREGSGPLLARRPDRALPDLPRPISVWLKTLPVFIVLVTITSLAIFNYEKSSSSTVNSILYALRTNDHARELLGDEIYFASKMPWISGELSPMQGTIDISFWVKGTKGKAKTKFVSLRRSRGGYFETLEWSLQMEDGTVVQLLEKEGTRDPLEGQRFD